MWWVCPSRCVGGGCGLCVCPVVVVTQEVCCGGCVLYVL